MATKTDAAGRRASKKGEPKFANYTEKDIPTRIQEFAEWLTEQTGYEVDPRSVYLGSSLRGTFQKSDENQARIAARADEIVAERAAREQARIDRAAAKEAREAEKAAKAAAKAQAEKDAAAAEKKTPARKTAAAKTPAKAPARKTTAKTSTTKATPARTSRRTAKPAADNEEF